MTQLSEILKLSPAEKILVIEKIWDTIESENVEVTNTQIIETERRIARFCAGKTKFHTWEEIKKELRG